MPTSERRAGTEITRARSPSVEAVVAAFERADFPVVRELLAMLPAAKGRDAAELAIIRARLARIEGDAAACEAAARSASRRHPDPSRRLVATALLAGALKRAGLDAASGLLFSRLANEVEHWHADDVGEVVYLLAVDAWEDGRYGRSEELATMNLRSGVEIAASRSLLGWIDVKREQYSAAAKNFLASLAAMNGAARVDVRLRARAVHALAIIASETIDLPLGHRVRRETETLPWTSSIGVEHFNTLTATRFLALLEGEVERAWLLSRKAVEIAPRDTYAAIGETNAAVASRLLGDEHAAGLQMRRAASLLDRVRWTRADHEERVALTNFAIEGARTLPAEARKAITRYQSLSAKRNLLNSFERDRRVTAFETVAAARVSEALGKSKAAIVQYRTALELWRDLGYTMRAALVAVDLQRLGADRDASAAIDRALERAPSAWFASSLQRRKDPYQRLTATERVVFAELMLGKSAKGIAADLGRSPYTIVNHTRKIFAAFGVNSRTQLLALYGAHAAGPTPARLPKRSTGR